MFRFAQHDSTFKGWVLLWLVSDFENNLAARVTSRDLFLRFCRVRKRERLRNNHLDFLLVDQLTDLRQLI